MCTPRMHEGRGFHLHLASASTSKELERSYSIPYTESMLNMSMSLSFVIETSKMADAGIFLSTSIR